MGDSDHLLHLLIQGILAFAVFSFLEYSIRTVHAPKVVNRRAKLICAAGLTLGVLGIWVLLFNLQAGIIMVVSGNLTAVASMFWLETHTRRIRPLRPTPRGSGSTDQGATDQAATPGAEAVPAETNQEQPADDGLLIDDVDMPDLAEPPELPDESEQSDAADAI